MQCTINIASNIRNKPRKEKETVLKFKRLIFWLVFTVQIFDSRGIHWGCWCPPSEGAL